MALRDNPYLPLYVQDFLTDEKLAFCSASATGVYIRLMCIMHKSEEYGKILLKQKFKQNDKQIKNFASQLAIQMPYDYNTILCALEELIDSRVLSEEPFALIQKRMVKDNNISEIRALAGREGGKKSFEKTLKNSSNFASNFAQAKVQANTEIDNDNEKENDYNDEFEKIWKLYGKKGNKKTSARRWANLKNHCREAASKHIPLYIQSTPDLQFRKNFETYLNQECWNDEIFTKDEKRDEMPSRTYHILKAPA